ncbi:MAG: 4-alpha-glucanotransferase, partial [Planctomycetes bacterium]|nr:4-alpha-glucanotransferase [Planctomycetota bacterium]
MDWERAAGLLLHPSSLPGPYGTGELGPQAHTFINILAECGCRLWQILPLGPGGYTNSPYAGYSAFAGNPMLISLEALREEGWLSEEELFEVPEFDVTCIDFETLRAWKFPVLYKCYTRFFWEAEEKEQGWFESFRSAHAPWLDDYALYMAIKDSSGGSSWMEWPDSLRRRHAKALAKARQELADSIRFHQFLQFLFNRQWEAIRNHCKELGIRIIGDVPIFVAQDSADVWVNQELFFLEKNGNPKVVAGVPPDYFSSTGQLWGNPLYNWKKHKNRQYAWWLARLQLIFQQVDIVRIDHFRGL